MQNGVPHLAVSVFGHLGGLWGLRGFPAYLLMLLWDALTVCSDPSVSLLALGFPIPSGRPPKGPFYRGPQMSASLHCPVLSPTA